MPPIQIRVRYHECDPMGVAHHAVYPVWFEMGRTEALRETGSTYAAMEAQGVFLVVVAMAVKYRRPARYDDHLELMTELSGAGHVKLEHRYALTRAGELLTTATTTLACVDRDGRVQAIPEGLGGSVEATKRRSD